MKCPKCGYEDDGAFCSNCGAELIQASNENNKTNKRTAIILVVVFAVIGIVALSVGASFRNQPEWQGSFNGNDREGASSSSYQAINETLYEQNGVSIEALGIDTPDHENFVLTMIFTNNSNRDLKFDFRCIAVNGFVFDTFDWIDVDKKSSVTYEFRSDYFIGYDVLQPSVVDKLDIMSVEIMSADYDSIDKITSKEIQYFNDHDYVINEKGYNSDFDDFSILYDDDKISIRMISAGKSVYDEYLAVLAVENKTGKDIICLIDDTFINDIATGISSYIYIGPESKMIERMWLPDKDYGEYFKITFNFQAYESISSLVISEGTTNPYP